MLNRLYAAVVFLRRLNRQLQGGDGDEAPRLKTPKGRWRSRFRGPDQVQDFDYCIEAGCAWWDAKTGKCFICRIAEILERVQENPA